MLLNHLLVIRLPHWVVPTWIWLIVLVVVLFKWFIFYLISMIHWIMVSIHVFKLIESDISSIVFIEHVNLTILIWLFRKFFIRWFIVYLVLICWCRIVLLLVSNSAEFIDEFNSVTNLLAELVCCWVPLLLGGCWKLLFPGNWKFVMIKFWVSSSEYPVLWKLKSCGVMTSCHQLMDIRAVPDN